jgi:similar to stage IV sporulation protein
MERFFNICRANDLYLWDIKRKENSCTCKVFAQDFAKMHPIFRKTATKVNVLKKQGLPFYFPFIKKRIIFFVGLVLCIAMLNRATHYVWAIEYVGNLQVSDDELTDFIKGENIRYGIKKSEINCEEKEKKLREKFENVTWVSIYFEGTKLYVSIKENEKSKPQYRQVRGTDIEADEDGVVVSIITRNGVPNIKAGDIVEKGQILVSGSVPVFDEEQNIIDYIVYDADADIYIETTVEFEDKINSTYPVVCYTGRSIKSGFFEVMGYRADAMRILNFFKAKRNMKYETVELRNQIKLPDNFYLPLYYGKIDRKEYYIQYLTYTENEMKEKLSDNLEKFILSLKENHIQIVEKNVKMVQNRNSMELIGSLTVIKPTGISVDIFNGENNDEN